MRTLNVILSFMFLSLFMMPALSGYAQTQSVITLDQCYDWARNNYPLIRQKELLVRSLAYNVDNVQSGHLPQVTIYAQATYQSEVTRLPGPGALVEPLSKDQYRMYAELNQTIYDGGIIKNQNAVQSTNTLVEQQKVEVELYKIKDRINQMFFGVLLMEAQRAQINLLRADLTTSLSRTESAIRNGMAFRTNADMLQAELLKTDQRIIEINSGRSVYLDMLGYFINQPLNEQTILQAPQQTVEEAVVEIRRPELTLYQFQSELVGAQFKANQTRNVPKLGLFVQGGYGRPGLNMLKNEFETYYQGGVRFSWGLGNFYNSKRDRQIQEVNSALVSTHRDTFLFNTNLSLKQQRQEVEKLNQLMRVDGEIITLRTRIKNTAQSQYDNGVISTSDLLRELNAEESARQNLAVHQIQLMLSQYNYQTTSGN